MNISSVQSMMQIRSIFPTNSSGVKTQPIVTEATSGDTVSISNEAQKMLQKASSKTLEEYQIPAWLGDLCPILINGNIKLTDENGNPTPRDKMYIRGGNLQDSGNLREYNQIIDKYYKESLNNNNITDAYRDIILNPEQSEKVKQDLYNRLASDERAKELMAMFNISLSPPK